MARVCDICEKGKISGKTISHSNRKTNRFWQPNIKKVKAIVNGSPKTVKVCTQCIKSGRIERAL
ncbi:MAG: 50S ribosomal protein L28 [Caldicoprobacterales bacterium]|jgi:large subunit ribosomal protein L28|nr:50S ribosomal protein L28 [Clostridiales bacterium]